MSGSKASASFLWHFLGNCQRLREDPTVKQMLDDPEYAVADARLAENMTGLSASRRRQKKLEERKRS